jgi:hypothetical protein
MRFISLISVVSLRELMHNKGRVSGWCLPFSKRSRDYALEMRQAESYLSPMTLLELATTAARARIIASRFSKRFLQLRILRRQY